MRKFVAPSSRLELILEANLRKEQALMEKKRKRKEKLIEIRDIWLISFGIALTFTILDMIR